ncbi:MAG: hypothetical protein K5641_04960 [Lachnospiraceae bacterium]|nr:hypothetical protein [Lachnospiraceae bacterium]
MKKRLIVILAGLLTITILNGCGEKKESAPQEAKEKKEITTQIANPWSNSDKQGVKDALGFDMPDAPSDATQVSYSYMKDGGMAQLSYKTGERDWTYRMQKTDKLTDISGMYYDWDVTEQGKVGDYDAEYLTYSDATGEEEFIDDIFCVWVVNWYDGAAGVTHSLSLSGKDLDGMDFQVYAESFLIE